MSTPSDDLIKSLWARRGATILYNAAHNSANWIRWQTSSSSTHAKCSTRNSELFFSASSRKIATSKAMTFRRTLLQIADKPTTWKAMIPCRKHLRRTAAANSSTCNAGHNSAIEIRWEKPPLSERMLNASTRKGKFAILSGDIQTSASNIGPSEISHLSRSKFSLHERRFSYAPSSATHAQDVLYFYGGDRCTKGFPLRRTERQSPQEKYSRTIEDWLQDERLAPHRGHTPRWKAQLYNWGTAPQSKHSFMIERPCKNRAALQYRHLYHGRNMASYDNRWHNPQ